MSFAVQRLSKFMHSLKTSHMNATIRVVRYVKHSPGLGIFCRLLVLQNWRHFVMQIGVLAPILGYQLHVTW